jgi:uncharacterized protein YigE (DUF2233 family)
MKTKARVAVAIGVAVLVGAGAIGAGSGARSSPPSGGLAVRDGDEWVTWWRPEQLPTRWNREAPLADRVAWRAGTAGLEWGELQLSGASEAWRTRVVVVRLDPRRVGLELAPAFTEDRGWTVRQVDSSAALALDAGQFRGRSPWGWVVSHGKELLSPQFAPLAGAVVVDSSGLVRVVAPDSVEAERRVEAAVEAFQSYPMLLENGVVPPPLVEAGLGVDLRHRDARLALGVMEDGRVIVALTRFDAFGETLGRVPFGLTSPEMAAVMGALGCRNALLLDGGISGQLLVRDADGKQRVWNGTRSVPLGLVGRARR